MKYNNKPLKPLFFALGTITFILHDSCKKNARTDFPFISDSDLPVITSFSPTDVKAFDTVTIKGKNFTGVRSVVFVNTEARQVILTSDTMIRAVVDSMSTCCIFGSVTVTTPHGSGVKDGLNYNSVTNPGSYPRIDGYYAAYEVGMGSLVGYWGFDSDWVPDWEPGYYDKWSELMSEYDKIAKLSNYDDDYPHSRLKTVNVVQTTGASKHGIQLNNGYLTYQEISRLKDENILKSFTLSIWIKNLHSDIPVSSVFQIVSAVSTADDGEIQFLVAGGYGKDTLALETILLQHGANNQWQTEILALNPRLNTNQWLAAGDSWKHIVIRYDGFSRQLDMFINGLPVVSKSVTAFDPAASFKLVTPIKVLIGSYPFKDDGFGNSEYAAERPDLNHGMNGQLDEIRIYDSALTNQQILALTHLIEAGR